MADIAGLSGAMHFLGAVSEVPDSGTITIDKEEVTAQAGDIVIVPNTSKEYLYNGTAWLELGDEVLYAKKADAISSTKTANGVAVSLGGTISAPSVDVVVTGGNVSENNESVVLGGTVHTAIEEAKSAVVGNPGDASSVKTIEGTRTYVDAVVASKNVDATVAENETLLTASASNNTVTVGSTDALKTAVSNANSAVQKVTILGHEIGNGGSVTVEQAKTDLGLGSAAYEDTTAFDAAGAASTAKNEVLGNAASDTSTSKTIEGTRKYAESLVSGGLTWIMLD